MWFGGDNAENESGDEQDNAGQRIIKRGRAVFSGSLGIAIPMNREISRAASDETRLPRGPDCEISSNSLQF